MMAKQSNGGGAVGRTGPRKAPAGLAATELSKRTDKDRRSITGFYVLERVRRVAAVLFVLGAILACLAPALFEELPTMQAGEVATQTVVNSFELKVADAEATAARQQEIRRNAHRFYRFYHEPAGEARRRLDALLKVARESLLAAPSLTGQQAIDDVSGRLKRELGIELQPAALRGLLKLAASPGAGERVREWLGDFLLHKWLIESAAELNDFVRRETAYLLDGAEADVSHALRLDEALVRERLLERANLDNTLRSELASLRLTQEIGATYQELGDLITNVLPNTLRRDHDAEQQVRDSRLAAAGVSRAYRPGDSIVERGERLTQSQAAAVAAFRVRMRVADIYRSAGLALVLIALSVFVFLYCSIYHRDKPFTPGNIVVLGYPVLLPIALGRLLLFYFGTLPAATFFFPSTLIGLLGVLLVEAPYALMMVVSGTLLMLLSSMAGDSQALTAFVALATAGATAVFALPRLRQRSDALLAGAKAGLAGGFAVVAMMGFAPDVTPHWSQATAVFLGGLASGILLYPAAFILERTAGITTDLRLTELTTIRHPLIQQLEDKAPGTYQHTLNVSKLAEAAAVAIGANDILTRAGVLFHDIGKMDKPKYFSENQVTPEDRKMHDKLTPHMSALIIKEHVRKGIQKAQEWGLPQRVIDFIPEHHGTTSIQFFLHKAMKNYEESESNDPVNPGDFRHVGPKPQSIETAVVLLADSVEAVASAKLGGATVDRDDIRRVVRDVINQKFREEQFDQCDLTLRDLSLIGEAFTRTLEGRFHFRVQYPGDIGSKKRLAGAKKKPAAKAEKKPAAAEAKDA